MGERGRRREEKEDLGKYTGELGIFARRFQIKDLNLHF